MIWFEDFIKSSFRLAEANRLDVALDKIFEEAGASYVTGDLLDSGLGELQGATDALGNVPQEQLYSDAVNIPTKTQYPQPSITNSGLQDSGIVVKDKLS